MNKTHLQLTLHHYMSCSSWDTLVLHVGMQRFLSQRVETVELNEATETVCSLRVCSRISHVALYLDLPKFDCFIIYSTCENFTYINC